MAFPIFLLCYTSIIVHGSLYQKYKYKNLIWKFDKSLAHILGLISIFLALKQKPLITKYLIIYWLCLIYILVIYYVYDLSNEKNKNWEIYHASIHIMGSIGMLALLFNIYETKNNKKINFKEIIKKF
jgi:hypothetical protein